jgi:hypothetical protein
MMLRLAFAALLALLWPALASAQVVDKLPGACPAGAANIPPNGPGHLYADSNGNLCTSAAPTGAPITGTYANGSVALSITTAQIFPANPARVRTKLLNNSGIGTAGGTPIVIWCRWGTIGAAPATAGGIGSFALQPNGGGIDDQGPGINQSALNCLSESGTPTLYAEQY